MGLFVLGVYLMIVGTKLLIPDKSPTFDVVESYSGNIWKPHVWKRSKLLASSFFTIPLLVYFMKFSMGEIFGLYIWYCIIGYKIIQVIIEFILIKLFGDQLLMGPISIVCDLMGGIFTFGADDFLTFLQSTFIDLCVLMIDRAYYSSFMNFATERVEHYYVYGKDYLIRHFFRTPSAPEELSHSSSGSHDGSPRSPKDKEEENDSDDSSEISNDPVFIEESSMEANKEPDEQNSDDDQQISFDESIEEEEEEEEKPGKKEASYLRGLEESKSPADGEGEEGKLEEGKEEKKEEKKEPRPAVDSDSEEEEEEAEPPLDMYNAFARNNVSQLLTVLCL